MDLYLARHGEATVDEDGLSALGQQQAVALGYRLRTVPLMRMYHGPLPRAAETASIVAGRLEGVQAEEDEAAGDYVPYAPTPDETPPAFAAFVPAMGPASPDLAAAAESRFTGTHEGAVLVITH